MDKEQKIKALKLADSYRNLNKKIGTKEGSVANTHIVDSMITNEERNTAYSNNGLMNTIVTAPVNDAFLTGITSESDEVLTIWNESKQRITEVISMARVYGGAWLHFTTNRLSLLTPYDVTYGGIELNPLRDDFLKPTDFFLRISSDPIDMEILIPVITAGSNEFKVMNQGLGVSVVDINLDGVLKYGVALSESIDIIGEMNQSVVKMNGLNEIVEDERVDDLLVRLEVMNNLKSNNSILLIDKEDDFVNVTKSLSGVKDVIQESAINVCTTSKMPYSRLFGRPVGGLASTGEGDLINYYDTVVSDIREYYVKPIFEQILSFRGVTGSWEFEAIYEPTEAEKATTRKSQIENELTLVEGGLIDEAGARESLNI